MWSHSERIVKSKYVKPTGQLKTFSPTLLAATDLLQSLSLAELISVNLGKAVFARTQILQQRPYVSKPIGWLYYLRTSVRHWVQRFCFKPFLPDPQVYASDPCCVYALLGRNGLNMISQWICHLKNGAVEEKYSFSHCIFPPFRIQELPRSASPKQLLERWTLDPALPPDLPGWAQRNQGNYIMQLWSSTWKTERLPLRVRTL